ncbi:hypothetical protein PHMEG_00032009 [Phytophthora megakarya]|uniref:HAT C-terminal dimerisation domain-containing protein n=1 Tax=Phytophthora megakarya TaxID=4795 RepID=A0A225UWY3_9STRA|nr:hypothetical protein PHMEG_00032009 [Phytophthora megakarya]
MLLSLVLHPAHRQASKKILDKTPLTTLGSLCRIGVFYYKKFDIGSDISGLYEDLSWWIKGDDTSTLNFADFSSVAAYWMCMQEDQPRSKLPQLALVILAFAVSTTTCERYFSELAMIHSAKRNRMGPEKARKLSLVRKRVREHDKADTTVKRRKLVDPTERTLLRDRDDRFESCEPESENVHTAVEGPDRAMEYWATVLSELEPDDDLQNSLGECGEVDVVSSPEDAATLAAKKARQFAFQVQQIKEQSVEPTTVPDQRPFPTYNDSRFPQEKTLTGLRGQKVSLADLSVTSVYCNDPVWHFASPEPFNHRTW